MVYIIDDDQYVREGFTILLKSAGFESSAFRNAEDFLKTFKSGENDLIILDMHMPGIGGCGLLKEFEKSGIKVPVIVITAYDEINNRECARNYGALEYFRKPVDSEALIDVIKFRVNKIHK